MIGVLIAFHILFGLLSFCPVNSEIPLQLEKWVFQLENSTKTYNAAIPSTLAMDLVRNKVINNLPSDPYYRDNILSFYKYQTMDVNYSTTFMAPTDAQGSTQNQLVFEGLDTHCDVFLNGKLILSAHNMFRTYRVWVTGLVLNNNLTVAFYSSAKWDMQKEKEFEQKYGFRLPANYSFTRKAAYQYGWDWGPRILTVGIWKPAYIIFGKQLRIDYTKISLLTPITSRNPSNITFTLSHHLQNTNPSTTYRINITIRILHYQNQYPIFMSLYTNHTAQQQSTNLTHTFTITKQNYENMSQLVWWTKQFDTFPTVMNITLIVYEDGKESGMVRKVIKTGFRTVKVKQNEDQDGRGRGFVVNLNGVDLFMKGANYIPPAMSMPDMEKNWYWKLDRIIYESRFNMLRVWGGGQFQNDEFYQTMDQRGILVWHDLMFACAMYPIMGPEDEENIRKQMEDNLKRLANHPSIALWNGNNEVWIGWQQWGWQKGLTKEQIQVAEGMYKKIFQEILPQTIKKYTPEIFYWETSPSVSSSKTDSINSGDIHFWRVWAAGAPIEEYQQFVGRFNSEYGMQSMPQITSLRRFTNVSDLYIDSPIMRLHQRHPLGDKLLPMYTSKYAGNTTNIKRYSYFTQVMQAYALQMAIVSLRGAKPYCMGSLYWQLNDVWPVSSWSTVDYYGSSKAAHFRVAEAYNTLLLHVVHIPANNVSSEIFKVVAVNDYDRKISLFTIIRVMDFNGTVWQTYQIEKTVSPLENLVITRLSNFTDIQKNRTLISVISKDPLTGDTYSNNYFFVPPVDRVILDPQITVQKTINFQYIFRAKNVANYVWIHDKRDDIYMGIRYNYFDLIPGQNKTITSYDNDDFTFSCYQTEVLAERKLAEERKTQAKKLKVESQ